MLFSPKKNYFVTTIFLLSLLSASLFLTSIAKAGEGFNVVFRDLTKDEETRHNKIGEDKLLILNYNKITKKESVIVSNMPSSVVFSKAVMCGNRVYPTVLIKRIKVDKPEEYYERNLLIIYNESLEQIELERESFSVSTEFSGSPNKFKVDLQPKFTLDTVEAFVCNSQATLCKNDEKVRYQCTFEDGRQANICWRKTSGPYRNTFRLGESLSKLDINHRVQNKSEFHKYSKITEGQGNSLSGIDNTLSSTEGDLEYSFENHWRTRSRDDYDFHTEFNVRKDGKIIESHRCIEGNYE